MAIREFQKFQGSKSSNGSNVHFRHHPSPQQRYLGAQYAKKRAKLVFFFDMTKFFSKKVLFSRDYRLSYSTLLVPRPQVRAVKSLGRSSMVPVGVDGCSGSVGSSGSGSSAAGSGVSSPTYCYSEDALRLRAMKNPYPAANNSNGNTASPRGRPGSFQSPGRPLFCCGVMVTGAILS